MATENITNPVEGETIVDYELLLPTGKSSLANPLVRLVSASFIETVYGYAQANIGFRTGSADYADRILKALEANGSPMIRFRIGQGKPDDRMWTPWQLHFALNYRGTFEGLDKTAGHLLNISSRDTLAMVDRASRTSAHRGKISDIVKRIADRNGLQQTVIEPTNSEGFWIQSYLGDFEFVRKRLIRVARSAQNRGNYLLFSRDNVLHFHTVEYQADVKELIYYNSPAAELKLSALAQEKIDVGSAGVRLIGHDPYTGQSAEASSSAADAVRFANWISKLSGVNGAQRNFRFHLSENRGMEPLNLMQNMYECARQESYQLELTTYKTRMMRAGDILNLTVEPKTGQSSAWSGLWFVVSGKHVIERGEIASVYVLQRGELAALKGVSSALIDQGVKVLEDEQNAPGVPVNLQAAQASQLTKGAGKSVSSGVFSGVQDPTKAIVPQQLPKPQM